MTLGIIIFVWSIALLSWGMFLLKNSTSYDFNTMNPIVKFFTKTILLGNGSGIGQLITSAFMGTVALIVIMLNIGSHL